MHSFSVENEFFSSLLDAFHAVLGEKGLIMRFTLRLICIRPSSDGQPPPNAALSVLRSPDPLFHALLAEETFGCSDLLSALG
jgi:hypothetical protein